VVIVAGAGAGAVAAVADFVADSYGADIEGYLVANN
jgi:hypothetical protein